MVSRKLTILLVSSLLLTGCAGKSKTRIDPAQSTSSRTEITMKRSAETPKVIIRVLPEEVSNETTAD